VQRLIGIEEYSGGGPKARQESEQGDANCGHVGVALQPLIFVFRQRSVVYPALTLLSISLYP
jgi:hypothetical protein